MKIKVYFKLQGINFLKVFIFFSKLSAKVGVQLIYECGLYTSFYGTYHLELLGKTTTPKIVATLGEVKT